ncbi:MAG: mucoidy inhibitor MuiA family protein [Pseudomonadota bacterium]
MPAFARALPLTLAPTLALVALTTIGLPAAAETIELETKIDNVTVYPRGAQVERIGKADVPAGSHVIRIPDLPRDVIPNTLRVEGRSTGALEIGAVDLKRVTLTREESEAAAAARKAIETEIERLQSELEKLGYDIRVKETQRDFLTNLAGLPARGPVPLGSAPQAATPDWAAIYTLIGTNMAEAQNAIFALRQQVKETERRIEDERRKLGRLAPKPKQRLVGEVSVIAEGALEADLTVRYQISSASWQPLYDARLTTGAGDNAAALELTRRASVRQSSGEAWTDVALSLSTVRSQGRTAAPKIRPVIVDFPPPVTVAEAPAPAPRMARTRALSEAAKPKAQDREDRLRGAPLQDGMAAGRTLARARVRQATVTASPFQATFTVPDRTSIGNDGVVKQVKIDSKSFEPKLAARTVPRLDPQAYLYATFKLPSETPYLAGTVSLFRDGTYVGRGRLPALSGGQEHELGFGADDRIRVKFNVANEVRSETGLITASRVDEKRYRISLNNLHTRSVKLTVVDRIPVSRDEEIKVELTSSIAPSKRNLDEQRGVLAWTFDLKPNEKKNLDVGFKATWPAEKTIIYR